jgi:hypothetical protein
MHADINHLSIMGNFSNFCKKMAFSFTSPYISSLVRFIKSSSTLKKLSSLLGAYNAVVAAVNSGANPTSLSYNATSSQVRFENKMIFFYFLKRL